MANQGEFRIVEFSPELKAAIKQYAETQEQMGEYLIEAYKDYPDTRKCDERDFFQMMEVIPGLSADQLKEKCTKFIMDYTGPDPNKRKKILDDFYDRFQECDIHALNLSCLKGEDKGARGVNHLTESEQDVMKLITHYGCTQSIGTKLKENPEYKRERFGDPKAAERLHTQSDTVHVISLYIVELLAKNHLSQQLGEIGYDSINCKHQVSAMDIMTQRMDQITAGMEGRPIQMDIQFSLSQEKNGLYGLDKGQLPGMTSGKTVEMAENAYDSTFGAVYNGFTAKERMTELAIDEFDLIHIDGLSAREQFSGRYQGTNLSESQIEKQIKRDIMRSVMEGSHHIDLITLDMNAKGDIAANPHAVKVDLHGFDQMEREKEHGRVRNRLGRGPFKVKTRADMADRINKDGQSVEDRLSHVIPQINEKLAMLTNSKEHDKSGPANHKLQKEEDSSLVKKEDTVKAEANGLKQGRKEVSLEVLKEKETGDVKSEKKPAWEAKSPQKSSIEQRKMGEKEGIGSHRAKDTHPVIGSHRAKDTPPVIGSHRAKDTQAGIGKH